MTTSIAAGQEAVYRMTVQTLVHDLGVAGSAKTISA
jgi:hypothetical protein